MIKFSKLEVLNGSSTETHCTEAEMIACKANYSDTIIIMLIIIHHSPDSITEIKLRLFFFFFYDKHLLHQTDARPFFSVAMDVVMGRLFVRRS